MEECLSSFPNTVRLGYREVSHESCVLGDWTVIQKELATNHKPRAATNHLRQIRSFYEEGEETVWITFHDNKLWWCRAEKEFSLDSEKKQVQEGLG
ncbi:hypothetical protein [Algoriphagus boritolerans]|uniref:hypothetical protein n=1 Tax=Algoriphagus boritolerans TaxID=308111 RepID=UPI002FCE4B9A